MSWQCSVCYEHNNRTNTVCFACGSALYALDDKRNDHECQWQCPRCTALNDCLLSYCEFCGYKHTNSNNISDIALAKQLQNEEDEKFLTICADRERAIMLQQSLWSSYVNAAIKQHQKSRNLQSFTALISALLKENVSDPKQKGLKNLLNADAIKNVRILLEQILNSSELLKYINAEDVQNTIDLVHRYWNTFAQSMQIIQSKQQQIDELIIFCNKWDEILKKRSNLKNGERLSDNDVFFMKNIAKTFTLWFQGDDDIDKLEKRWTSLHKALMEQHMFWKRKTGEIEQKIGYKMQKEQEAKSRWNIFANVTKWIATAAVTVGAVVGIVFSGPIGLGMIAVSAATAYGAHTNAKAKIDKVAKRMMALDQTTVNVKYIQDTFASMKQDSSTLEIFFKDFMTELKAPKDDLSEINEELNKNEQCMFEVIEDNVESMIESLDKLQKIFQDIIRQMNSTLNQQKYVVTKR